MPKYAVIDNTKIINTILAESIQDAESITGFTCVEFTEETAEPGGTYENGRFIKIKPYPSWILNEDFCWESPIPYPGDKLKSYIWSEETISWIELEPVTE